MVSVEDMGRSEDGWLVVVLVSGGCNFRDHRLGAGMAGGRDGNIIFWVTYLPSILIYASF